MANMSSCDDIKTISIRGQRIFYCAYKVTLCVLSVYTVRNRKLSNVHVHLKLGASKIFLW